MNLTSGKLAYLTKKNDLFLRNKETDAERFFNMKGSFFLNKNDIGLVTNAGKNEIYTLDLKKYGIESKLLSFLHDDNYLWIATDRGGGI